MIRTIKQRARINNKIISQQQGNYGTVTQEKQLEIVNLISLFDGEIAQSVRVIQEAKQLRSGMLSDLLSGEHEIPATYDKVMGAA